MVTFSAGVNSVFSVTVSAYIGMIPSLLNNCSCVCVIPTRSRVLEALLMCLELE